VRLARLAELAACLAEQQLKLQVEEAVVDRLAARVRTGVTERAACERCVRQPDREPPGTELLRSFISTGLGGESAWRRNPRATAAVEARARRRTGTSE